MNLYDIVIAKKLAGGGGGGGYNVTYAVPEQLITVTDEPVELANTDVPLVYNNTGAILKITNNHLTDFRPVYEYNGCSIQFDGTGGIIFSGMYDGNDAYYYFQAIYSDGKWTCAFYDGDDNIVSGHCIVGVISNIATA